MEVDMMNPFHVKVNPAEEFEAEREREERPPKKPKKPTKPRKKKTDSANWSADKAGKSTAETNEEEEEEVILDENGEPKKNYKEEIVEELSKIMAIYKSAGEKGKVMGYRRAITNIKTYKRPIVEADQLKEIPFVGKGMIEKVTELIADGKMSRLNELQGDDKIMTLDAFGKIWGVGEVKAK